MISEDIKPGMRIVTRIDHRRNGKWGLARVVMKKKNGWFLCVTDCGKEINRTQFDIHDSAFDVLDEELTWLFHGVRCNDKENLNDPGAHMAGQERLKMKAIGAFANYALFSEKGKLWCGLRRCRLEFKRRIGLYSPIA